MLFVSLPQQTMFKRSNSTGRKNQVAPPQPKIAAQKAPSKPVTGKATASPAVQVTRQSTSDPMLSDTYVQEDVSPMKSGQQLDDFEARLNGHLPSSNRQQAVFKTTTTNVASAQARKVSGVKQPPKFDKQFRQPALTEDELERQQDIQDVASLC